MTDLQGAWRETLDERSTDVLADETRHRIVRTLRGRGEGVSERELAERLAGTDAGSEPETGDLERLRIRLCHVHLPKLDDCGLVDWDRTERTVTATGRAAPEARGTGADRDDGASQDGASDPLASASAVDRRREVVDAVEAADGHVSRESLARALAPKSDGGRPSRATVEDVAVRLHHVDLPKLDGIGVVEYDRDAGTVVNADSDYAAD